MYIQFSCRMLIFLLIAGCAQTKVEPGSKKAVYHKRTGDVVWNGKVFESHWWSGSYEVDKMFLDDKEAQRKMRESERLLERGEHWLFGSTAAAIGYLFFLTPDRTSENSSQITTTYYGIFGVGLVANFYYLHRRRKVVKEAVEEYNERHNYVLSPYIQQFNEQSSLGLAFAASF